MANKTVINIPESESSESDSDKEKYNFGNTYCKPNESENLFTENDEYIPNKKMKLLEVVEKDDATNCSSPSYEYKQDVYSQNAQRWSTPDYTVNEPKKPNSNSQKQFSDAAVMTTGPDNYYMEEINENIRISNLMFCKFISHELERYTGDERYCIMQQLMEVFKKKKT